MSRFARSAVTAIVTTMLLAAVPVPAQAVKARILMMVSPEYPGSLRAAGKGGTVDVEALVGDGGDVVEFSTSSADAALENAVRAAMPLWAFQPPACSSLNRYVARFTAAFTHEGEQFFVTVRNLRFAPVGARDEDFRPLLAQESGGPARKRIAGDDPEYPRKALYTTDGALTIAALDIAADGSVEIQRVFSFPDQDFNAEVRRAVGEWRFEPLAAEVAGATAARTCVIVNFIVKPRRGRSSR